MLNTSIEKLGHGQFVEQNDMGNVFAYMSLFQGKLTGLLCLNGDKLGLCNESKQVKYIQDGKLVFFYWDRMPFKGIVKQFSLHGKIFNFIYCEKQKGIPKHLRQYFTN